MKADSDDAGGEATRSSQILSGKNVLGELGPINFA